SSLLALLHTNFRGVAVSVIIDKEGNAERKFELAAWGREIVAFLGMAVVLLLLSPTVVPIKSLPPSLPPTRVSPTVNGRDVLSARGSASVVFRVLIDSDRKVGIAYGVSNATSERYVAKAAEGQRRAVVVD